MATTDLHDDSDRSGDPSPDRDDWTRYLEERGLSDVRPPDIERSGRRYQHFVPKAAIHRALVRKIRDGWQPGTWSVRDDRDDRDDRDEPTHPAPVLDSSAQIDTFYAWVYRRGLERIQKRERSDDDE
jgi:hypothetical protein